MTEQQSFSVGDRVRVLAEAQRGKQGIVREVQVWGGLFPVSVALDGEHGTHSFHPTELTSCLAPGVAAD